MLANNSTAHCGEIQNGTRFLYLILDCSLRNVTYVADEVL